MTIDLDKYQKLKRKYDNAKVEADRAEGAYNERLRKLKDEFECETIEEAEQKLEELQKESERLEAEYNQALEKFEETWSEKL